MKRGISSLEMEFLDAIEQVMDRFNVQLFDYDNFDDEDSYTGTDFTFENKKGYPKIYLNVREIL